MASDPQSPELKQRLLEAGRTVFARVGYTSATVDDVIEEAGTSRATFYRYFRSKDGLFGELSRACFRDMRAIIDELAALPSDDRSNQEQVEEVLARYRDMHARHGGVFRAWFERSLTASDDLRADAAVVFDRLVHSMVRPIAAAGVPSSVSADVQAALLYLLIVSTYGAATARWSRIDPDRIAPTLATMIDRAYLGGDGPARGGRLRVGGR